MRKDKQRLDSSYFLSNIFPYIKKIIDSIPYDKPHLSHYWYQLREFIFRKRGRSLDVSDLPARISLRTKGIQEEFEKGITTERLQFIFDEILTMHTNAIAWYPLEAPNIANNCELFFELNKNYFSHEQIQSWKGMFQSLSEILAKHKDALNAEESERVRLLKEKSENINRKISEEEFRCDSKRQHHKPTEFQEPLAKRGLFRKLVERFKLFAIPIVMIFIFLLGVTYGDEITDFVDKTIETQKEKWREQTIKTYLDRNKVVQTSISKLDANIKLLNKKYYLKNSLPIDELQSLGEEYNKVLFGADRVLQDVEELKEILEIEKTAFTQVKKNGINYNQHLQKIKGDIKKITGYQESIKRTINEIDVKIQRKEKTFSPATAKTPTAAVVTEFLSSSGCSVINIASEFESSEQDSVNTINYLNTLRTKNGRTPIVFDKRVFDLAVARAKDMRENNYLDHTNPVTGTCPDNMKTKYGLRTYEFVAENALGNPEYSEGKCTEIEKRSMNEAIDGWMTSRGHRYNLLFTGHKAGAVGCYKNMCIFLGLNYEHFGEGCYTAEEGRRQWENSPKQPGEI